MKLCKQRLENDNIRISAARIYIQRNTFQGLTAKKKLHLLRPSRYNTRKETCPDKPVNNVYILIKCSSSTHNYSVTPYFISQIPSYKRGTGEKYCHVQAGNGSPSYKKSRLASQVEVLCGALGTTAQRQSPKKPNDS
jgi:hypothetical protein